MHLMNALENGLNSIVVRTVDTDVIVVLISEFHAIHEVFPEADFGLLLELARNSGITTSTLCVEILEGTSLVLCLHFMSSLAVTLHLPYLAR